MDTEQIVEQVEESVVETAPEVSPVESKARELGWKPKEEFHGDEEQFIDAGEFLRRKPLFDKIENMGKELKETKKVLNLLQSHHAKVKETEYARALAELKSEKKRALEEGDADRLIAIDDTIADLRTQQLQQQKEQQQQPEVHPEFQQWQDRNKWYSTDNEMREFADSVGTAHAKSTGKSPAEVLKYVEERVRKAYPEKFTNPKRTQPSAVDSGGQGDQTATSKRIDITLSEEERRVMNTFVRSGVMTKEEYMSQLKAVRGN